MIESEKIINAIKDSYGVITTISQRTGMSRREILKAIESDKHVMNEVTNEEQRIYDLARARLIKAVNDGEPWAIKYILETGS